MIYKTLDDIHVGGRRILLRIDLNSEVIRGRVVNSDRIIEHAKTIRELLKRKARVVVMAHQGRPGEKDFLSLKKHSKILNRFVRIKFVNDILGKKALKAIDNLKDGEALLLENVRFLKEEFKPSVNNKLVRKLGEKFDIYINDAFSISHRKNTSIVSFPKILESGMGRVMENELRNIEKMRIKDCLFILGGAKVEDDMLLINKKIITGGIFSLVCLIAAGKNLGLENELLRKEKKFFPGIKRHLEHIKNPVDLAVRIKGKRREFELGYFPQDYRVLDIGEKTVELYEKEIKKAKRIFWKGTMGYCEDKDFCLGTKKLLRAIEKSQGFCVVAGGHSSGVIKRLRINKKKIGYVSLSGGALIHYLAGKKLPGLEVLKKNKN